MSQELGFLSERFEASSAGSLAIGYDSTGGTSYGKYQIASKTGTMKSFLSFLKANGYDVAYKKLIASGNPDTGSTTGAFPTAQKALVNSGDLGSSEHDFIKATHYDLAFDNIIDRDCAEAVNDSFALQNVLQSTSVQHGAGGAGKIFNQAQDPQKSNVDFIKKIYAIRATKFGSSTPRVRASVQARFDKESAQAIDMVNEESDKPPLVDAQGKPVIQTIMNKGLKR